MSLLFADLRGFTELAGQMEFVPLVSELLSHVMDCLTEAVLDYEGYVLDYFGDGLAAMWNAPVEQPEHAVLACSAALQMLSTLPAVAADWIDVTRSPLRLGIGVHTGSVQLGNAGSAQRVKYGPRGPTVHLASRVEAATKELGLPLIATQPTVECLPQCFVANRVCCACLPGLTEPVALFSLRSASDFAQASVAAWRTYKEALDHFEQGRLREAADRLMTIDPAIDEVPHRFLAGEVQRELGCRLRRRSTDKPSTRAGVINLRANHRRATAGRG